MVTINIKFFWFQGLELIFSMDLKEQSLDGKDIKLENIYEEAGVFETTKTQTFKSELTIKKGSAAETCSNYKFILVF